MQSPGISKGGHNEASRLTFKTVEDEFVIEKVNTLKSKSKQSLNMNIVASPTESRSYSKHLKNDLGFMSKRLGGP